MASGGTPRMSPYTWMDTFPDTPTGTDDLPPSSRELPPLCPPLPDTASQAHAFYALQVRNRLNAYGLSRGELREENPRTTGPRAEQFIVNTLTCHCSDQKSFVKNPRDAPLDDLYCTLCGAIVEVKAVRHTTTPVYSLNASAYDLMVTDQLPPGTRDRYFAVVVYTISRREHRVKWCGSTTIGALADYLFAKHVEGFRPQREGQRVKIPLTEECFVWNECDDVM